MPVAVRNNTVNIVSFSQPGDKTLAIAWGPKDSKDGSHIQQVSDEIATKNTNFLKAVGLGILEPVSDDEMAAAIMVQASVYKGLAQAEEQSTASLFETTRGGELVITAAEMDKFVEQLGKQQTPDQIGGISG